MLDQAEKESVRNYGQKPKAGIWETVGFGTESAKAARRSFGIYRRYDRYTEWISDLNKINLVGMAKVQPYHCCC